MFEQQQRKQNLQQKPTIVITDGKLGNRGVAAGIPAIHQRDMQLMNNSVMETTSAHFRRVLQDLFALETMIITLDRFKIPRKSLLLDTYTHNTQDVDFLDGHQTT